MKSLLPSLAMTLVAATSLRVSAAEVCKTIPECKDLKAKVDARLNKLLEAPPIIEDGVVKYSDGTIMLLNFYDAAKVCSEKGLRLPTARELALYAEGLGAAGIAETHYPKTNIKREKVSQEIEEQRRAGWTEVLAFKVDHTIPWSEDNGISIVDFYYNPTGYKKPQDISGDQSFWSSSFLANSKYLYQLHGDTGKLGFVDPVADNAVRCVPKN